MRDTFRIGVTPDFYIDAAGTFEHILDRALKDVPNLTYGSMPPQPGKMGTPEALNQFDAIISLALKYTADSLKGADRLTLVARWGVGYDMIDVDALTQADVMLAITPAGVRRPVAEAILTFIFALTKDLLFQDRVARQGQWRGSLRRLGTLLPGKTLGSVGCGNIAQELFRIATHLGFGRMIACDPVVKQEQVAGLGVELVDMDTVFRESDYVCVNTLLNASTTGLVGERHFRLMKPSAYFINTARGPIVQHDALVRALREKWIAGAGIDVFPTEPPPKDDPLFELDNCTVAPHGLAWTAEGFVLIGTEACENCLAISRGELPGGIVNREVIDRPGFQKKLARWKERA
jgi:phosphoglycerate dehydrogenase-like enzyme